MNFEASSGMYPKRESSAVQREKLEAVQVAVHDLVHKVVQKDALDPDTESALQSFEQTLDNSILFAPVREGGPKLATTLEMTGDISVWHKLVKYGMEAAQLRPGKTILPGESSNPAQKKALGVKR